MVHIISVEIIRKCCNIIHDKRRDMRMKKRALFLIVFVIVMLFSVPAHAENVFANRDQVNVYTEPSTDSAVKKVLRGGESVMLLEYMGEWTQIAFAASDGPDMGYVQSLDVVYVMPSQYCNHQWSNWSIQYEPSCTQPGMLIRDCPVCGIGETQEIPALGHTFGTWTVTREATCTSEGLRSLKCQVCGYEETQVIEKAPHTFENWTVSKQATCTAEGERFRRCFICGYEEKQIIDRLPHSYGNWTVLKYPSCTEEGKQKHTCTVCGYESTETIAKIPHDFEWKILEEATDHSVGIRTNVCKSCGYTEQKVSFDPEGTLRRGDRSEDVRELQQLLVDQAYLNAGGADGVFGGGTEKAVMKFQDDQGLTPDGVAWPQTRKRLQHEFGDWTVVEVMTRETPGERVRKCKDCSYEQHEVIAMEPYFERGRRGDDVRAAQQMLTAAGYDAGAYDGIYGGKFDSAFSEFAKANELEFTEGKVLPSQIDALVGCWIKTLPEEKWKGESSMNTPVDLALTINTAEGTQESDEIITCSWSLTNMGEQECVFLSLLLSFGDDPDFRKDDYVMALDGATLQANCGNSVSGSFTVNRDWGEGNLNFAALAVSEQTGETWLSNIESSV